MLVCLYDLVHFAFKDVKKRSIATVKIRKKLATPDSTLDQKYLLLYKEMIIKRYFTVINL